MKNYYKFTLLLIGFIFSSCYSFAQENDDYSAKIDSLIEITNPRSFNGVILITKNGKTMYSKAYGYENFSLETPLKMDNQFEIMSITKQITSVLLLKEVERGKVNLQSSIKTYLPNLTQNWADSVSVHQLLNHTNGIISTEDPLAFKPGTDFKYSNLASNLLGEIIENVVQKSYRELSYSLFQSLEMKNTFCFSEDYRKNMAYGHLNKNNVFEVVNNTIINENNLPADGVIATAKDLSIWNSKLHNGKILNPETYILMTTESAKSKHNVFLGEKMGYGYNIRIIEDNGIKYFGHTGLGDGFASMNIYIPKSDISIVVLENQMNEDYELFYYFESKIKDIVLKSNLLK